jgi:putative ABC transport system permease protein
MLTALFSGVRNLIFRTRSNAEIEDELKSYLDSAVQHHIAEGHSPEEALRRARLEVGNIDSASERVYASRWESIPATILQDVRFGARLLKRSPTFTVVAVLTLAIAIGATTAMFSIINAVLLRPFPFREPNRLAFVWETGSGGTRDNVGFATFEDWRRLNHSFSHMVAMSSWTPTLVSATGSENLKGVRLSSGAFDMLGVRMLYGRDFVATEDIRGQNQVVILGNSLWRQRFNSSPDIVGKSINLNGKPYTVVGVLGPDFPSVFAFGRSTSDDIYSPLAYNDTLAWACRDCRHLRVLARIANGVPESQALAEMNQISRALVQQFPTSYPNPGITFVSFHDFFVDNVRSTMITLISAVSFVLLIACVNVANLLLGWNARRRSEFALRSMLGAPRARLVRQLLTESCVLFLLGGSGGILLAAIAISLSERFARANLPHVGPFQLDASICTFALLVSLLTAIIFGLLPAKRTADQAPAESMTTTGRSTASRQQDRARNLLIIFDVSLALVLLAGAGLMTKSFVRLMRVHPGFDQKHTLAFSVDLWGDKYKDDDSQVQFFRSVLDRISALPGVESAGLTSQLPLAGNVDRYGMHIVDKPNANPADDPSADRYSVSPGYFRAMRIPLIAGRTFTDDDRRSTQPVAVISETFARTIWPGEDPLGKLIRMGDPKSPAKVVVGVVGDVLHDALDAPHSMQAYLPNTQMTDSGVVIVVRAVGNPTSLQKIAAAQVAVIDPTQPISALSNVKDIVAASLLTRRFATFTFIAFAGIALLLTSVGIYGVVSYLVGHRTREIGIRMALGAQQMEVLKMVLRQGMKPALLGTVVGMTAAALLARVIASMLFGIRAVDAWTFATVPICILLIALLACYVPARRATKVEPTVALRYE